MALTPEEVINKRFQATKFKEGYNPEEVDDFLDEVVIELRRLNAENASLKRQLEEAENRVATVQTQSAQSDAVEEISTVTETSTSFAQNASEQVAVQETSVATTQATNNSAATLLAMAQKVHDDYVLEGQREKDRLLSEGREQASQLLTSAEEERVRVLGDLDETKSQLETTVEQLRDFEDQFRSGLREYLQEQMQDLETGTRVENKISNLQVTEVSSSENS